MTAPESGILNQRLEYVRESTYGTVPTNPDWLPFSDNIMSLSTSPSAPVGAIRTLGSADINEHFLGAEEHSLEVDYHLQQGILSGGNPQDASADGLTRGSDNLLPNSHTVLKRDTLDAGGAAGGGARIYTVATGCKIGTVSLAANPEDDLPVDVTLSYTPRKVRFYQIDQPASSTSLEVVSTDAGDTTQTLTIEDDSGTTEDVALNGTTVVTTAKLDWTSIDAARLDAETVGDVTIGDGTNTLMTIHGTATYNGRDGDLGVPVTGTGSHASALGSAYERLIGDTIERPAGTDLLGGVDISSVELTVENNLDVQAHVGGIERQAFEGVRDVTLSTSVFGASPSVSIIREHLQKAQNNIVWTLDNSTLTLNTAILSDPGTVQKQTEQAVWIADTTFEAQSLTVA